MHAEERASLVDVDNSVPIGFAQIEHRLGLNDAGIVDEDVNSTQGSHHVVHHALHRADVCDVNGVGQCLSARHLNLGTRLGSGIGVVFGHHNGRALARQPQCHTFANALPGAGDDRNFTAKLLSKAELSVITRNMALIA